MAWTLRSQPAGSWIWRAAASGARWLLADANVAQTHATSDFATFDTAAMPGTNNYITAAVYDGTKWQALSDNNRITSTDGVTGAAWQLESVDMYPSLIANGGGSAIAVAGGTLIALRTFFTRSTDGGATWADSSQVGDSQIVRVGTLWVALNGSSVLVSADDGVTWAEHTIAAGLSFASIGACPAGWIATQNSIGVPYISTDNGATWSASSLPSDRYRATSANGLALLARQNYPTPQVSFSADLVTWTQIDMTGCAATYFDFIVAGPELMLVLQDAPGEGPGIYTTALPTIGPVDLVTWADGLDPLMLQDVYVLTIAAPGFADIDVPVSSWQATANEGAAASFVMAVVPGVTDWIDAITERQGGELIIKAGIVFSDGTAQYEEVIRSSFTDFRYDRGPRNATGTLSGYTNLGVSETGFQTTLKNVRALSMQGGKRRATCALDMFLRPGMTVTAMDQTFVVGFINYYANSTDRFCQVGER